MTLSFCFWTKNFVFLQKNNRMKINITNYFNFVLIFDLPLTSPKTH